MELRHFAPGYQLVGAPHAGGFGVVFKAVRRDNPGAYYAVKFAKDPRNAEHVRRLRREAVFLTDLCGHPHVVRMHEQNLAHSWPYVVLEYVEGGTLESALDHGVVTYESLLQMVGAVASALEVLHSRGGFHRDVSPNNIMLAADGAFVLTDFGMANAPEATSAFTRDGAGTPGYFDPDAARRGHDPAADVYSLGAVLARALTGEAPDRLRRGPALSIRGRESLAGDAGPEHAEAMCRLVYGMTHPDPALRPSAADLRTFVSVCASGGAAPPLPHENARAGEPEERSGGTFSSLVLPAMGFGVLVLAVIGIGVAIYRMFDQRTARADDDREDGSSEPPEGRTSKGSSAE